MYEVMYKAKNVSGVSTILGIVQWVRYVRWNHEFEA